jgi:hypothetical protein
MALLSDLIHAIISYCLAQAELDKLTADSAHVVDFSRYTKSYVASQVCFWLKIGFSSGACLLLLILLFVALVY